jgi:hypothetical protein
MQKSKQGNRIIWILLAFVAAAGLGVAAFGPRWLTEPDHTAAGFGLTSYVECAQSDCKHGSIADLMDELDKKIARIEKENEGLPPAQQRVVPHKPWGGFPIVGMITFIAALLAAVGLLGGALLAVARKRPELPILPTTLAVLGLFISIIAGCVFVATKPAAIEDMEVGWTFLTFGGAAVLGLASVFPLNRQIRPIDHELGEASATMSWGTSPDD